MQTPKTSTKGSSGSRLSPRSGSSGSGRSSSRAVRQLKTTGLEPVSSTSQPSARITSPKVTDRVSPRGPVSELQKNRLGRIAELEAQVTQLEDALSTVKDQLIVSESWKKQAKVDAEESRKELLALSSKLEETQKLLEQPSSNEAHEEDNDESIKKSTSTNSTALAAALLEIDQLKVKLATTIESEATKTKQAESAEAEVDILKQNIAETHSFMNEMKNQLENCKVSESKAQDFANETLLQLETARRNMESLSLNSDAYNAMVLELEHSRARICSLEAIIANSKKRDKRGESDMRCYEEQGSQILKLTADLKKSKEDIEELKANLMDKETELQCVVEENEGLNTKLASLVAGVHGNELKQEINGLKSKLTNLETKLQEKCDENEKLKLEIKKLTSLETELREKLDEIKDLKREIHQLNSVTDASKHDFNGLESKLSVLEMELCEKLDENEKLTLEIKKMDGVAEAVKMRNCELDEELKRLKLQMGQWRKAAEVATAMLCDENTDNNGRMVGERAWSMGHYSPQKKVNRSPINIEIDDNDNDDDDEFLKRKNSNMLKRIGVLWKKPQNK